MATTLQNIDFGMHQILVTTSTHYCCVSIKCYDHFIRRRHAGRHWNGSLILPPGHIVLGVGAATTTSFLSKLYHYFIYIDLILPDDAVVPVSCNINIIDRCNTLQIGTIYLAFHIMGGSLCFKAEEFIWVIISKLFVSTLIPRLSLVILNLLITLHAYMQISKNSAFPSNRRYFPASASTPDKKQ